ncbi:carbohydrate sulfotransferase 15-like [Mya arenaria]|uniref:carbohydrate sulfotransferase 15-like n=1 Tax=Mya arenaria TaxID=6604 RepID=UPI0022DF2F9F|nr:carbohydrate sulfotransferase 15-like [Mya arenaria]XP_052762535.1 carbohydrate sulfotransferase 15-like [Mya arenaria]XP_052762536.1 carbohydrate sulfotransferase 15-like [Mya arenaria]XP_052762537.1 carbohydrate sulfotransferase 15-like [Mya arenaria]
MPFQYPPKRGYIVLVLFSAATLLLVHFTYHTYPEGVYSLHTNFKGVTNGYTTNEAFNVTGKFVSKNGSTYPASGRNTGNKSAPISTFYVRHIAAKKFPLIHLDLMKMEPFTFLEEYKNPCYAVEQTEDRKLPLQCIPYFYLIGAPKSGTTDLFRRLIKHREISEYVVKEPHWLTRKRFFSHNGKVPPHPYWSSYEEYFRAATAHIYAKKDPSGFHPVIVGDCSASTLWDNDYWTFLPEYKNLTEPLYTNADYIHHFNPDAKIIAIVRNPIDRLYSDYLFFKRGINKTPDKFHEGVKFVLNTTRSCLERNTLRHCLYKPDATVTDFEVRLRIGVYHLYLNEYFRVFPKQQILVIKMEDYSKHTPEHLDKIFDFLNVARLSSKNMQEISSATNENTRKKGDRKIGDMFPETRKLLRDFYNSHNNKLGRLLGQQFNYNRDEQGMSF